MMYKELIARKCQDGRTQSLSEHLNNVADISASKSHYPNISKLIAYLHDLGKASTAFQNYLQSDEDRGSVIHAWQGAFLANELFQDTCREAKLIKEIISFCVTAHHNALDDGLSPFGMADFISKFSNVTDDKYSFEEIKSRIPDSVKTELQTLFELSKKEIGEIITKIQEIYKSKSSANFTLGLLVKYLFSCLVDADRLDAYLFEINETFTCTTVNWDALIKEFENNIAKFPCTSIIEKVRRSVSEKCKAAANKKTGIYQLSVPTGGGKTLSTLRFALHHCKQYEKKRIIYVIPYLSIIEQTADNLRRILSLPEENKVIFEHHSNIMEPENENASMIRRLTAARWDSPIIITTMVRFMETVMSSKSGVLRKFASMADSVIIFDEIQSMPVKAVHCFNEVVTFLSKILNTTIVLCSATQPTLEATQRTNLILDNNAKLIDCGDEFQNIKRVTVTPESEKDCVSAADFILEKANVNGNCLVIVNTKKTAFEIYNQLIRQSTDFEVLHLSTSMCQSHRVQVINLLKESLKNQKRIICVSTQLIEAGVDISFSCVIRAMSGLDSIAQAAGRCNRNGESIKPKIVYTFPLKDENLDMLPDIKSGKEITLQIVKNNDFNSDLLEESVMTSYYQRYFSQKNSQMDYPTTDGVTIYAMLSDNEYGKQNYKNRTGKQFTCFLPQAFRTADAHFVMIDKNAKTVVVYFGESENLINEYLKQPTGIFTKEKAKILRKLEKYCVSLYEHEYKKLSDQKAIYPLDEETGMLVLAANYYSSATGVVTHAVQENLIV